MNVAGDFNPISSQTLLCEPGARMLQLQDEIVEVVEQEEKQEIVELSASDLQSVGGGGVPMWSF
ncbi:MAG TPA: hypothetical protein VFR86_17235 [Burkholderiaceae bacterium]|nr:hypothetical protein [Burkholderiaceae bacterium]